MNYNNLTFGDHLYLPLEKLVGYYGEHLGGVQLPFNFQLLQSSWNAREIAEVNEPEFPQGEQSPQ